MLAGEVDLLAGSRLCSGIKCDILDSVSIKTPTIVLKVASARRRTKKGLVSCYPPTSSSSRASSRTRTNRGGGDGGPGTANPGLESSFTFASTVGRAKSSSKTKRPTEESTVCMFAPAPSSDSPSIFHGASSTFPNLSFGSPQGTVNETLCPSPGTPRGISRSVTKTRA